MKPKPQITQIFPQITRVFIIGFWAVMMGLLVQKEFLPQNIPLQKIKFPGELPYIKSWGVYTKSGRKGYLKNEILLQPDGFLWKNEAVIEFLEGISICINGTAVFDIDEKLENFQITLSYEDFIVNLAGTVEGDILRLKTSKAEKEYILPWASNMDIMNNTMIPWFYIQDLRVGDKFQWYLLNPLTRIKDLVKTVVRRSSFYYNKKDFVPVTVVDMYYQDMRFEFWIDNEGNPLKVATPWGWELEAE